MTETKSKPKQKRTKRQHYVARSYLRAFEDATGGIYFFDKRTGKVVRTGVDAVGFQNLFYDLDPSAYEENDQAEVAGWQEKNVSERIFQYFENDFLELRRALTESLTDRTELKARRIDYAMHLVVQWLRTPAARDEFEAHLNRGAQALCDELMRRNFPGREHLRPTATVSEATLRHTMWLAILDKERVESLSRAISRHHWMLAIAPPECPFVTSDHPIARRPHVQGRGPWGGFSSPGIELVYPFTPQLALWIREPTVHKLPEETDGLSVLLTREQVDYLNCLQVFGSQRYLFGSGDDWGTIEAFLGSNPPLKDGAGLTWRVKMHPPKTPDGLKQDMEWWVDCLPIQW